MQDDASPLIQQEANNLLCRNDARIEQAIKTNHYAEDIVQLNRDMINCILLQRTDGLIHLIDTTKEKAATTDDDLPPLLIETIPQMIPIAPRECIHGGPFTLRNIKWSDLTSLDDMKPSEATLLLDRNMKEMLRVYEEIQAKLKTQ